MKFSRLALSSLTGLAALSAISNIPPHEIEKASHPISPKPKIKKHKRMKIRYNKTKNLIKGIRP